MDNPMRGYLQNGDFHRILTSSTAQTLLGGNGRVQPYQKGFTWNTFLRSRLETLVVPPHANDARNDLFIIGCAALQAFLQSNVTGPPLSWSPAATIFSQQVRELLFQGVDIQAYIIASLTVDGEAVYKLTPHVELFGLANFLLNHPKITQAETFDQLLFRVRVNFWHQKLLSDIAPSLQNVIYQDLASFESKLAVGGREARAEFLIERAAVHAYYGFDDKARADLAEARILRGFKFALTGRLGKRTKYQEKALSQLVVLAKSAEGNNVHMPVTNGHTKQQFEHQIEGEARDSKPLSLLLDDDTLLETISFAKEPSNDASGYQDDLSPILRELDPANQPSLDPLDSIILLATASSITNTSPQDGLTREETLPYATRVLDGGSTNWQIYTQALIIRSRIEGYKSRTTERGLLQLQVVVDQVIAETTSDPAPTLKPTNTGQERSETATTTFLPQLKPSESAPNFERLRYIFLLASPTRWNLESELADRWVSLGGLRSALEIYERLEMWAEVALCWAAQEREDKAREIIRGQLYIPSSSPDNEEINGINGDSEPSNVRAEERDPLPNDAPRLFCILGDIEKSIVAYERAWEVSSHRYARAQRSLGKHYFASNELEKSDEAYAKSLVINPQNHSIWFALGCVRLQLEKWNGAVDAFLRAVQIEDKDAESWSNLAAAILRLAPETSLSHLGTTRQEDTENPISSASKPDPQKHIREAFSALKRAAALKRDSYRIWQNVLHVAVQLTPPPYTDIIVAQTRLIDLRSNVDGEKCIDIAAVEGLLAHLIATAPSGTKTDFDQDSNQSTQKRKRGFEKMLVELIEKRITPLITSSRRLWLLIAKLSLHLSRPLAALTSYEKAWRVTLNQPGWESGASESEELWMEVAEATSELVDAYESLGERKRESGLAVGQLVAKDWRFKARSAVRGVLGRASEGWEGSQDIEMLRGKMEELKSV